MMPVYFIPCSKHESEVINRSDAARTKVVHLLKSPGGCQLIVIFLPIPENIHVFPAPILPVNSATVPSFVPY